MELTDSEVKLAIREIVYRNPREQAHTIPGDLYDRLFTMIPPQLRFVDTKLADAGYQNTIAGLFGYTLIRGEDG